jgi:transposase
MGVKHPRRYGPEFIDQALRLAKDLGSMNKAADKLGIPMATLNGWSIRKRRGKLKNFAQGPGVSSVETAEEENKRLRKEVEELKKANYILKRAAAFFSQDHLK